MDEEVDIVGPLFVKEGVVGAAGKDNLATKQIPISQRSHGNTSSAQLWFHQGLSGTSVEIR